MSLFYQDEWQNLSTKVKSLLNAGAFIFHTFQTNNSDTYGSLKDMVDQAKVIYENIKNFQNNFNAVLPKSGSAYLTKFIKENDNLFNAPDNANLRIAQSQKRLTILTIFESNFSYYLSDTQVQIRKNVEVAFAHLQRQLVADETVQKMWASKTNETDFEKLGGTHLLLHKI